MKRIIKYVIFIIITIIIFSYGWVEFRSKGYTHNNIENLPERYVGLIFGTSASHQGRQNLFFLYRVKAAGAAYKAGKIKKILVSGDNSRKTYNEPEDMTRALVQEGVKEEDIILDYAGFRTLDSLIRAKKVFGQTSITVISQEFQNERAVVIGHARGIDIIGFNAKDVPFSVAPRVYLRETLARVKLLLDLYLLKTQPKFLGEPIVIE